MIEYDMISKSQTHRKQKENINNKKVVFIKLKKKSMPHPQVKQIQVGQALNLKIFKGTTINTILKKDWEKYVQKS